MTQIEITDLFAKLTITYKLGIWKLGASVADSSLVRVILKGQAPAEDIDKLMSDFSSPSGGATVAPTGVMSDHPLNYFEMDGDEWGEADDYFSQSFFIANSGKATGEAVTLVKRTQDEYTVIHHASANAKQNRAAIVGACRDCLAPPRVVDGVKIPAPAHIKLYDFFRKNWEYNLKKVSEGLVMLLNQSGDTVDAQMDIVKKYIPLSMLSSFGRLIAYKVDETYTSIRFVSGAQGSRVVKVWDMVTVLLDSLPENKQPIAFPVSFSNQKNEPCMKYLDTLNLVDSGMPCPTWDFYLERFTKDEGEVYKAFIWSIMESTNTSRQALYVVDNGFTGKSVVSNAITKVLGINLVQGLQKNSLKNQFAIAKVWDKRLIIFDDNNNPRIMQDSTMKMITGRGVGDVELKKQNSFSAQLTCRVIINSNVIPTIDTSKIAERTRLIILKPKLNDKVLKQICELNGDGSVKLDVAGNPKFIGDSSFEEKLQAEFWGFMAKCQSSYSVLCPKNSQIILPDAMMSDIYDSIPDEQNNREELAEKYLKFGEGEFMPQGEVQKIYMKYCEKHSLDKTNNEYGYFKSHLETKYGVKFKQKNRQHCALGISDLGKSVIPSGEY